MPETSFSSVRAGALLLAVLVASSDRAVAQAPVPSTAPVAPARRITLDDALVMAEGGSEQVAVAEAGVQRADGQISLARSALFPQANGAIGYQRTLQTQFSGIFDTDTPVEPCAGLTVNPGAPIDQRVAELERYLQCPPQNPFGGSSDLPFGQLNTWTATLQIAQNVWDAGQTRARERQARAGRDAASLGVTTTRAQLDLDVAVAYYDAALADRLTTITESTLAQAEETLRQIDVQFQVGQIAEFEVLRARVSRDNQRSAVIRARIQRDLAYLRLKQLINVPADQPIELDANLTEPRGALASRWAATLAQAEAGFALVERTAVKQTEAGVRASEAAVAVTKADFLPHVTASSTFIAYAYDPLPAYNRRDWTVGASVSMPLLDGGRRKANRAIAEATLEESRQQLQLVKELAELDQRSARATWEAARAAWDASAGTVEEAQRAYQIADVRYREGLSTQLELNDARLALERAEAARAQAARDLQLTRARLALLPDLPIGAASGGGATATAVAAGNAQPPQGSASQATAATATQTTGTRQ
ncbi:transporter [Luteitalea sp. TBR-22]|uniref:TolC family protein n=1 Tax=Luteitalea sp. TBR-22 TaxID=2802971 RepID=UPI001AFC34AC|nr:TolC family protein [Luteitalea sp. TBR-22]BCS34289.1 transporter [Luteitalea sp. TBR-22]